MTKNEQLRNTVGYYLLFISLGFGLGIIGPALPSLAEQTGSTLGAIGSIFLVSALGGMLGTAVSGQHPEITQHAGISSSASPN